jgi:hypothetical protein
MNARAQDWTEANQRYLTACLAMVRATLARHVASPDAMPAAADAEQALREAAEAMPAPAALDTLCDAFSLSPFERELLLLCAGVELDSYLADLCVSSSRGQRVGPTFRLALAALPEPHWSAITPAGPLRHWRLLEVGAGEMLTTSTLKIDERILHYLAGVSYRDPRLQGLLELQPPPADLPQSHRALAERIAGLLRRSRGEVPPIVHFIGDDFSASRAVAAMTCAALGFQVQVLEAANVPANAAEREALARLWEREAVLGRSGLLIELNESENQRAVVSLLQQTHGCLLLASRAALHVPGRNLARFELSKPSVEEQMHLWREAVGPAASELNGELEHLAGNFRLGAEAIADAWAQAQCEETAEKPAERLWDICRIDARRGLDGLAQRIEPAAAWSDLVLPAAQLQTLRNIAAQVRCRTRVYGKWGFASKSARGLGISALFAGESGTGKTMAAEVLARELRLDLYRIDLSQVVNKYIGETEKNLRRVFDAAEAGGAVLLFDEADALFGKRSDVKDSHDRYANIEVSYLLQRMESYRGLAILTTNMRSALDPAFLRRLRFIVEFPFPDSAQRAEIWRRIYPAQTPVENLDVAKLARLNVAGGNIRNIAMQAAFLAAGSEEPVRMRHLLRAAHSEYAKLERQLTDSEARDWA